MRYFFSIALIFFTVFSLNGQEQSDIDSVKRLLSEGSDTSKIRNYLVLAEWISDTKEWMSYNSKALDLIDHKLKGSLSNEEEVVLLKFKSSALNNVGFYHKENKEYQKAYDRYREAKNISVQAHDLHGEATVLINMGALDIALNNPSEGILKYMEALKIFNTKLNDKKTTATLLNNIGNQFLEQGNIQQALNYFNQALALHKEVNNRAGEVTIYSNYGALYYGLKEYQSSVNFFEKALKIYEELDDKRYIAKTYSNMGVAVKNIDLHKALHYDSIALKLLIELDDKAGVASSYNNIGSILCEMNMVKEGKSLVYKALAIRREINEYIGLANSAENLAEACMLEGKKDSALYWAKYGFELAEKLNYNSALRDAAETLSKVYNSKNDFENAYKYYRLFKQFSDSVINKQSKNAASQQLARLELEKREVELKAEQEKKEIIFNQELEKKNMQRNAFLIGFAVTGLLLFFVFKNYREKKKANAEILDQKKEVEQQKHLVEEKNKEILDSIRYAKRIQNSLLPTEKYVERNLNKVNNKNQA